MIPTPDLLTNMTTFHCPASREPMALAIGIGIGLWIAVMLFTIWYKIYIVDHYDEL